MQFHLHFPNGTHEKRISNYRSIKRTKSSTMYIYIHVQLQPPFLPFRTFMFLGDMGIFFFERRPELSKSPCTFAWLCPWIKNEIVSLKKNVAWQKSFRWFFASRGSILDPDNIWRLNQPSIFCFLGFGGVSFSSKKVTWCWYDQSVTSSKYIKVVSGDDSVGIVVWDAFPFNPSIFLEDGKSNSQTPLLSGLRKAIH